ncbi:hypothetical protein [Methanoregula sp.]|uniref:hypothetical protein n=1 Tax=Methanoregula sp. TaxID=2052170 RepID=UPI003C746ACA
MTSVGSIQFTLRSSCHDKTCMKCDRAGKNPAQACDQNGTEDTFQDRKGKPV